MNAARTHPPLRPLWWDDGKLAFVDIRRLPQTVVVARAASVHDCVLAIENGAVSGSRFIDLFAAHALVLAATDSAQANDDAAALASAAAPYVHRFDAFERVRAAAAGNRRAEAADLQAEIFAIDRSVAEHAAALLPVRGNVLTAGGTGAQSTGGYGTASGALVTAHRAGRTLSVYVAESRPALTGARITAAELRAEGVPLTLIPDAAVAATIGAARIDAIIVGAEAIAANGDTIAELGTLALALAAAHHRIPLFVAAPRAAVDPTKRRAENLSAANRTVEYGGSEAFAAGCDPGDSLCAPAARYDVTPGNMIAAIVTEFGISRPPYIESLAALANRPNFAMVGPRTRT